MGSNLGNWKIAIGTAALAAGLTLFAGAPGLRADDECQERIVKADRHLHEAIRHHGFDSKQADKSRLELRAARRYCWEHSHKWWDVEGNQWHSDHDWDDHDHDHDLDRERH
jgi:hypothetical protein